MDEERHCLLIIIEKDFPALCIGQQGLFLYSSSVVIDMLLGTFSEFDNCQLLPVQKHLYQTMYKRMQWRVRSVQLWVSRWAERGKQLFC